MLHKHSIITYCIPKVILLYKKIQNKPQPNTQFFQISQVKALKFNFIVLLVT